MNLDALCHGTPVAVEPGVHLNMPRTEYDRIPAISATVLKKWLQLEAVPSEFSYWLKTRWDEPISESLLIGLALDTMLLEPGLFERKFAVIPENAPTKPSRRQREAKKPSPESIGAIAWWDSFNAKANGKQILTNPQCEIVNRMLAALRESQSIDGVFENCQKVVLIGELFGLPAKAEIDLWNVRIPHILDLKTAADVSPIWFADAARKFGYLEQASFYLLLARACGFDFKRIFTFIAVRNTAPWTVKPHQFAPFDDTDHWGLFEGTSARLKRAAAELSQRLDAGEFQDDLDWQLLKFPEWVVRNAKMDQLAML
jgi:hypothetical protein